jgi:hypothetical protein
MMEDKTTKRQELAYAARFAPRLMPYYKGN